MRGAREEHVDPEASAATTHNWKAVLKTGNTMEDDDKESFSTREDVSLYRKTTIITWHDVFSDKQQYEFEQKPYISSDTAPEIHVLHL